jgi:hypothetical protein
LSQGLRASAVLLRKFFVPVVILFNVVGGFRRWFRVVAGAADQSEGSFQLFLLEPADRLAVGGLPLLANGLRLGKPQELSSA